MRESVYRKGEDGAIIWFETQFRPIPKWRQAMEDRLKLLFSDVKDEDLDALD